MTVLLVRHAEPVAPGVPGYEENERPLSADGRRRSDLLAERLMGHDISAVYTSPYPRARQTVEPLADRLGIPVTVIADLRERLLGPAPVPSWRDHVERSWADFSYSLEGGESSAQAQARVLGVLEPMLDRHSTSTAVAASHGNLIALALHAFAPQAVDFEFWRTMPMPAVYAIRQGETPAGPGLASAGHV